MREETPDRGVELRRRRWEPRNGDDEHEVLEVAVPVVNPQSTTRDSAVDGDALVGEIPISNAEVPPADDSLDAAAVTILEERVTVYYPRENRLFTLTWVASTDDWEYDEHDLPTGEFDLETSTLDAGEAVLWERE
ncbi:hypothetical protein [Haladaptatus salinisoli]|uniref:hypothetical protein n=1 Tax=Haladaptatus salinisoli TaxID=2884876 RepID=UPI001D0A3B61|nr:hypothetical protein [Haladaptatus salinisoli]